MRYESIALSSNWIEFECSCCPFKVVNLVFHTLEVAVLVRVDFEFRITVTVGQSGIHLYSVA